jgi:hypothetical protein
MTKDIPLFTITIAQRLLGRVFFEDGEKESQCTIITAKWGILEGQRIVRGREAECLRYYEEQRAGEQEIATS